MIWPKQGNDNNYLVVVVQGLVGQNKMLLWCWVVIMAVVEVLGLS